MADIIIRKAKKDYVCDVCGHIIHAGDEYLDKVITHDGKAVRHERYHDECPHVDDAKQNKFIHKLLNSKDMLAINLNNFDKFHVTGLAVGVTGIHVEMADWGWNRVPDVFIKTFLEEYDYE